VSVIIWALMVVVTLKYVILILRADNRGEGGIMALTALAAAGTPRRRTLLLLTDSPAMATHAAPDAYIVHAGDGAQKAASALAESLRDAGFAVAQHGNGGSFKSQMKKADASGARFALVIGDSEVAAGTVAVKALRDALGTAIVGEQAIITSSAVAAHLRA